MAILKTAKRLRLFTFVPGTRVKSAEVNAELNQLVAEENNTVDDLTTINAELTEHKDTSGHPTLYYTKSELGAVTDSGSGADKIGATPIPGVDGDTVQEIMEGLKLAINVTQLGQINDGSITDSKLGGDVKVGSLASLLTTAKTNVVTAINEIIGNIVTVATPDKLLKLNADGKLPANITGDAMTVGGYDVASLLAASSQTPKSKFDATVPPTVTDDASAGYSVGSIWVVNSDPKTAYMCFDATAGAATWTIYAGVPEYYYDEGQEFITLTGGWIVGFSAGTGTQSKAATYLSMSATRPASTNGRRTYVTDNPIDLTRMNKLKMDVEVTGLVDASQLQLTVSDNADGATTSLLAYASVAQNRARGIVELDVSAITGSHYIALVVMTNTNTGAQITVKAYKVWGEEKP